MQQRVNLARALVVDPKILLMDEPFASLDAQTRELMQEELTRIWAEARKTVLFIYPSDRRGDLSRRQGRGVLGTPRKVKDKASRSTSSGRGRSA